VIGEDQHSALTVEEHGNLGETLKGPETVTGFSQKDYTSQHLGGTGTANFTFLRSLYSGGGVFVWKALSAIFRAAWSFCWLHVM